jgi:hypothetical protein
MSKGKVIDKTNKVSDEVATITQHELKEYLKLKMEIKEREDKVAVMRQSILDRDGLGATVQEGPLVVKITPDAPRLNSTLLLEEIAKHFGESIAKEMEQSAKKSSGSKRLLVESR